MIHKEIIEAVCSQSGLSEKELLGPSRAQRLVSARFMAYWLIRRHCEYTLDRIGRIFGDRDHTTILHGLSRAEALANEDEDFDDRLSQLDQMVVEHILGEGYGPGFITTRNTT